MYSKVILPIFSTKASRQVKYCPPSERKNGWRRNKTTGVKATSESHFTPDKEFNSHRSEKNEVDKFISYIAIQFTSLTIRQE